MKPTVNRPLSEKTRLHQIKRLSSLPLLRRINGLCLLMATIGMLPTRFIQGEQADVVFLNGTVVTVDNDFQVAEAVAVKGDRIVAVGSNAAVRQSVGDATRVVDLQGRMMLPGLIDSHVHATGAATFEFDHVVPDVTSVEDVLKYIGDRADILEDGEWIAVQQMFITRLAERRFPLAKSWIVWLREIPSCSAPAPIWRSTRLLWN
ncbi:MAG: amidohydrolase family protein [Pirellulaceae bacterium]